MTDAIVVGAGLSGLVAATEIAAAGKRVVVIDQEPEQSLGGQAHWSLGGLFLVDSPEQRRLRIRDSIDRAREDWVGAAGFDRPEDHWPQQWAEAYLQFAAVYRQLGVEMNCVDCSDYVQAFIDESAATPANASNSNGRSGR